MLITLNKFGGTMPLILDPAFLPEGKSQQAICCRFDQRGLTPFLDDVLQETSTRSGLKVSIFRYYNTVDGEKYFFTWITDVDAVTAPLANDVYARVYYTEGGLFKVTDSNLFKQGGTVYPMEFRWPSPPAPSSAPMITGTPVGTDPTLEETRAYVYTYVNDYGDEGPPSDPSNLLDIYDGNEVDVFNMDTGPYDPLYGITKKRIYRLNQTSTGTAVYQFVDEIDIAALTYTDTILDADLGEVLPSLEWDGPPSGIQGLIALPNGILAGFVDNLLCLSVPFYPHAWPARYQKPTDRTIVALGAYGSTIVVVTEGQPYLVVGNDPGNMVMEKMDLGFSCVSKRGLIQAGDLIAYPSPEGLVVIGPQVRELVTRALMTRDQWNDNYNPSSISGYYWDGKYVGFYELDGVYSGFIYDFKTGDFDDLDFYASAGYYDKTVGILFLQM